RKMRPAMALPDNEPVTRWWMSSRVMSSATSTFMRTHSRSVRGSYRAGREPPLAHQRADPRIAAAERTVEVRGIGSVSLAEDRLLEPRRHLLVVRARCLAERLARVGGERVRPEISRRWPPHHRRLPHE